MDLLHALSGTSACPWYRYPYTPPGQIFNLPSQTPITIEKKVMGVTYPWGNFPSDRKSAATLRSFIFGSRRQLHYFISSTNTTMMILHHYVLFLEILFFLVVALDRGQAASSSTTGGPSSGCRVWDGRLSIAIITNASTESRILSLRRLMNSLLSADYKLLPTDAQISLNVNIDVAASPKVVYYMQSLIWPYGPKTIHR